MPAQHDGNDVSFISIGLQSDIFQNIRIKKKRILEILLFSELIATGTTPATVENIYFHLRTYIHTYIVSFENRKLFIKKKKEDISITNLFNNILLNDY